MTQAALTLPQQLVQRAHEHPNRLAMLAIDGARVSYGDAYRSVGRWSHALGRVGVRPGDRVVTMLPNSLDAYHVWLGIAWLGALEVPVNPAHGVNMLRYFVANAEAEVMVTSARYSERLRELLVDLPILRTVILLDDPDSDCHDLSVDVFAADDLLSDGPSEPAGPAPQTHDIAAIIYTSGTTGPSKGVIVPWGEICEARNFAPPGFVAAGEPYYTTYPPFHLGGKAVLVNAVDVAGHVVLRETFSASKFWDDMREHDVCAASLLGPIVSMLLAAPVRDNDADNPLTSVLTAPVPPTIHEFQRRFGVAHVATGFGTTEIGFVLSTGWDPPNLRTCGRPRIGPPHVEVKIVNEQDHEVPTDQVGELVVRARDPWHLNAGYWRMPEATSIAWRNGWFHTGDGFRQDADGWFYFVDRMKDALRRRGENVSCFELEATLTDHPDVLEAAVIGVPSELGEDDIKAVVVRRPGSELDAEQLTMFLQPRVAPFMLPRYVEFVPALPKTDATMRVRKVELRANAVNDNTWDREHAPVPSGEGRLV